MLQRMMYATAIAGQYFILLNCGWEQEQGM